MRNLYDIAKYHMKGRSTVPPWWWPDDPALKYRKVVPIWFCSECGRYGYHWDYRRRQYFNAGGQRWKAVGIDPHPRIFDGEGGLYSRPLCVDCKDRLFAPKKSNPEIGYTDLGAPYSPLAVCDLYGVRKKAIKDSSRFWNVLSRRGMKLLFGDPYTLFLCCWSCAKRLKPLMQRTHEALENEKIINQIKKAIKHEREGAYHRTNKKLSVGIALSHRTSADTVGNGRSALQGDFSNSRVHPL